MKTVNQAGSLICRAKPKHQRAEVIMQTADPLEEFRSDAPLGRRQAVDQTRRIRSRATFPPFQLFALLALAFTGCQKHEQAQQIPEPVVTSDAVTMAPNAPQIAALTIETVGAQQQAFVPLTGRLVWDEDATVRVFTPFAGIVRQLLVNVNDPVTKGMPLAVIQSADYAQVQSDARKAESDFLRAERNLNRLRDLSEKGAAARKDLESAEADFASAQAERERTRERLAIYISKATPAQESQGFVLPSPLDGVLVERTVTLGQEVRPDQMLANLPQFTAPLFLITDPKRLWIWLDVTEMHLPLVHKGQELLIRSKAFPEKVFKAQLDMIGESLDPITRTVRARGSMANPDGLLKAELYVTVELPDAVQNGLQIPSRAVFLRDDQYYVFLEMAPGKFNRQGVRLGPERDGKVAILDGLKEGQRLVTEGCLLLQSLIDSAPRS
jgi:cobalt-zinc-cadmium efflux system membrane fusion protein